MVSRQLGRLAGRMARAGKPLVDKARATDFARSLRDAYEEGRRGDDEAGAAEVSTGGTAPDEPDAGGDSDEAHAVAEALHAVDWATVRAATAEKGGDVARAMKSMAAEVDWARVQSGAARVSSALIAAVASGQIPVGGRLAGPVARAIMNDRDLAGRVHTSLQRSPSSAPPDFRGVIDVAGRDEPA